MRTSRRPDADDAFVTFLESLQERLTAEEHEGRLRAAMLDRLSKSGPLIVDELREELGLGVLEFAPVLRELVTGGLVTLQRTNKGEVAALATEPISTDL